MQQTNTIRVVAEAQLAALERTETALRDMANAMSRMAVSLERVNPAANAANAALNRTAAAERSATAASSPLISANQRLAASYAAIAASANAAVIAAARRIAPLTAATRPHDPVTGRFTAVTSANAASRLIAALPPSVVPGLTQAISLTNQLMKTAVSAYTATSRFLGNIGRPMQAMATAMGLDRVLTAVGRAASVAAAQFQRLTGAAMTLASRGLGAVIATGRTATGVLATMGGAATGLAGSMGRMLGGISVAAGAIGTAMISSGAAFEQATNRVFALTDVTEQEFQGLVGQIMEASRTIPLSLQQLSEGFYYIVSAGIPASQALDVLTASAQAAVAGQADLAVVADGVTSVMLAYKDAQYSARDAADILTRATILGKTEFDTFAHSIGRVLPLAAQLDVPFQQVAASLAVMTRLGLNSDEAATALRAALGSLTAPAKETIKELETIGLTAEGLRKIITEQGLVHAFRLLYEETGGNIDRLDRIIPNIRGLTGFLTLANSQGDEFAEVLADINKHMGESSATTKAFDRAINTLYNQIGLLLNQLRVFAYQYFLALEGSLKGIVRWITAVFDSINQWIKVNPELFGQIARITSALSGLALVGFGIPLILQAFGGLLGIFGAIVPAATRGRSAVLGIGAAFSVLLPALAIGTAAFLGLREAVDPRRFDVFTASAIQAARNLGSAFGDLGELAGGLWSFIMEGPQDQTVQQMIDQFAKDFDSSWNRFLESVGYSVGRFGSMFDGMGGGIRRAWGRAGMVFDEIIENLDIDIGRFVDQAVRGVIDGGPAFIEALNRWKSGIVSWFLRVVPEIANNLDRWTQQFFLWVGEVGPPLLAAIGDMIGQWISWIAQEAPRIGAALGQWTVAFIKWVVTELAPRVIVALGAALQTILNVIDQTDLIQHLTAWSIQAVTWIVGTFIPKVIGAIMLLIPQLAAQLLPALVRLFFEVGTQAIGGLVEGLLSVRNPLEALVAVITGIWVAALILWATRLAAVSAAHTLLAITHLPRLWAELKFGAALLASGMIWQIGAWTTALKTLGTVTIPGLITKLIGMRTAILGVVAAAGMAATSTFLTSPSIERVNEFKASLDLTGDAVADAYSRISDLQRQFGTYNPFAAITDSRDILAAAIDSGATSLQEALARAETALRNHNGNVAAAILELQHWVEMHPLVVEGPQLPPGGLEWERVLDMQAGALGYYVTEAEAKRREDVQSVVNWKDDVRAAMIGALNNLRSAHSDLVTVFGENIVFNMPDLTGNVGQQERQLRAALAELPKATNDMGAEQIAALQNWRRLLRTELQLMETGLKESTRRAGASMDEVRQEFIRLTQFEGIKPKRAAAIIKQALEEGWGGGPILELEIKPAKPKNVDDVITSTERMLLKHKGVPFKVPSKSDALPDTALPSPADIVGATPENVAKLFSDRLSASSGLLKPGARDAASAIRGILAINSEPSDGSSPLRGITTWGRNIVTTIAKGMSSASGFIFNAAKLAGLFVRLGFLQAQAQAWSWGYNTGLAYAAGLRASAGAASAAAASVTNAIAQHFRAESPPGPASALHDIMDWGFNTIDAYADGISSAKGRVLDATRNVMAVAASELSQGLSISPSIDLSGTSTGALAKRPGRPVPVRGAGDDIPRGIIEARAVEILHEIAKENKLQNDVLARLASKQQDKGGPLEARSLLEELRIQRPDRR